MTKRLPKKADEYVASIGRTNAAIMLSVAHKGVVQGGRVGSARQPNIQVVTRDDTVLRYRVFGGRLESGGLGGLNTTFAPRNLSDPLNAALHQAVSEKATDTRIQIRGDNRHAS